MRQQGSRRSDKVFLGGPQDPVNHECLAPSTDSKSAPLDLNPIRGRGGHGRGNGCIVWPTTSLAEVIYSTNLRKHLALCQEGAPDTPLSPLSQTHPRHPPLCLAILLQFVIMRVDTQVENGLACVHTWMNNLVKHLEGFSWLLFLISQQTLLFLTS